MSRATTRAFQLSYNLGDHSKRDGDAVISLLSLLKTISAHRSRRRREYPMHGMLAVLILAAAHGENSLRGMWQWARAREEKLLSFWPLGLWVNDHLPSLGTFWYLLTRLSADALQGVLRPWGGNEAERVLGGKVRRGSKRAKSRRCVW